MRQGGLAYVETEFPHLDKFIHCNVQTFQANIEEVEQDMENEEIEVLEKQLEEEMRILEEEGGEPAIDKGQIQDPDIAKSGIHVGVPIAAAIVVFAVLFFMTRKGKKKATGKAL